MIPLSLRFFGLALMRKINGDTSEDRFAQTRAGQLVNFFFSLFFFYKLWKFVKILDG